MMNKRKIMIMMAGMVLPILAPQAQLLQSTMTGKTSMCFP